MKTFENKVDEMIDAVIKLTWNYTLFCKLFEKQEIYTAARQAHPEFFLIMHDTLVCSFFVAADLLFCEKSKATSLCTLIREIEGTKPVLAKELNDKIPVGKGSLTEKIGIMRNQVCAHRWEAKSPQAVFTEAAIQLKMMREVTDIARCIICELAQEAGGDRKESLGRQWLSTNTLQAVANDAGLVMHAFVKTV